MYWLELQGVVFSSRGRSPLADSCTFSSECHVLLSGPTQSPGTLTRWWACCCSALPFLSRKRSVPPRDELVAFTSLRRHKERKAWGLFTVLGDVLTRLTARSDHHCCSFLPLIVSLHLTSCLLWLLLSAALLPCSAVQSPVSDRNYTGIFHFKFLLVCTNRSESNWMKY